MTATLRRRLREDGSESLAHDDTRDLLRLVADCAAASIGRSVLVLRLSLLPRDLAQPHHLRLAAAALEPLRSAERARRFDLRNMDIVWAWRGDAEQAVQTCRRAVGHLFAAGGEAAERDPLPDGLLHVLALPAGARALLGIIEASLVGPPEEAKPQQPDGPPLDLARLSVLEAALQQADLARFARRRPVCLLGKSSSALTLAWEKRLLSIEELSASLVPDRSVRADRWLFRRLTRTLDRRMLALLSDPRELREAGRFSLNLNVASIVSPEFIRFDETLPARLRGEVLLELHPADVIADAAAYLFAREFTRMRGYRLLLRGLTPMLLRTFPRQAMAVDWLELLWSPDLPEDAAAALGEADPACMVLGRADTAAALAWARRAGITHVRGRTVHPG